MQASGVRTAGHSTTTLPVSAYMTATSQDEFHNTLYRNVYSQQQTQRCWLATLIPTDSNKKALDRPSSYHLTRPLFPLLDA